MKEYIHILPGEEGEGAPWHYKLLEEHCLLYNGRQVLYIIAEVLSGSVCVGAGTLRYIHVPGYVVSRHSGLDSDCRPVSAVAPVDRDEDKLGIEALLTVKHPSMQVCFSWAQPDSLPRF